MGIEKKTSDFFFKPLNDEAALEKVFKNFKKNRVLNFFMR